MFDILLAPITGRVVVVLIRMNIRRVIREIREERIVAIKNGGLRRKVAWLTSCETRLRLRMGRTFGVRGT